MERVECKIGKFSGNPKKKEVEEKKSKWREFTNKLLFYLVEISKPIFDFLTTSYSVSIVDFVQYSKIPEATKKLTESIYINYIRNNIPIFVVITMFRA